MSRRKLLLGGAAAASAAIVGLNRLTQESEPDAPAPEAPKHPEVASEDFLNITPHPRPYSMGILGKPRGIRTVREGGKEVQKPVYPRFGPPLNTILGVNEGRPHVDVDYKYQLAQLMKGKIQRIRAETGNISGSQLRSIKQVFDSYTVPENSQDGLDAYRAQIGHAVAEVRSSLDINTLSSIKGLANLDASELRLLKLLERKIDATTILTYALTEIMPTSGNAHIGVEAMDYLLKNAGRAYLECVPALYDKYLSFGPYQFTSLALYNAKGEVRGASYINRMCRKPQIPGSVILLRGNEHHKAAYLFAVYNLVSLVKSLPDPLCDALGGAHANDVTSDLVLGYVAASHHLPVFARRAFGAYAKQLVDFSDPKIDPKKKPTAVQPYIAHAAAAGVGPYVQKTHYHRAALRHSRGW